MTAIDDALSTLVTLLRDDFDPTPQPRPLWVVNYPSEYASLGTYLGDKVAPGLIVNQQVNRVENWAIKAVGRGRHVWHMEITALLMYGRLTSDEMAAEAAQLHTPYIKAMADLLYANMQLGATVNTASVSTRLGAEGQEFSLFQYRIGMTPWWNKDAWGISFSVPITQYHTQTMAAY